MSHDDTFQGSLWKLIKDIRYAMLTHRGPMARVQATYVTGFAAIEQLGMAQDPEGFRLERYDRRYTPTVHDDARPDNAYDILIPLYG